MSDTEKQPSQEAINLFNSMRVLSNVHTFLNDGTFPGYQGKKLVEAQEFVQNLYQQTYNTLKNHEDGHFFIRVESNE